MARCGVSCKAAASTSVFSVLVFLLCRNSAQAVTYDPGLEWNAVPETKAGSPLGLGLGLGTTFGTWGSEGQEQYTHKRKVKSVSISALGGAKQSKNDAGPGPMKMPGVPVGDKKQVGR